MDGRPVGRAHGEASSSSSSSSLSGVEEEDTLQDLLGGFTDDGAVGGAPTSAAQTLLWRLWTAALAGAPRLHEASRDAAHDLVAWTRRGGAPRALLVLSVGSASLAALTGLLVLMFFVSAATTNAIICSFIVSLIAAGGFLTPLLAFLAMVYLGALSVAVFVIVTMTAATVIVITIATGWAAFFWIIWFAATKCLDLVMTKQSIRAEHSAL